MMGTFLLFLVAVMLATTAYALHREHRLDQAARRHVSRAALRRLEAAGHIPPSPEQ